jgi:hypothetical protein
LDETVGPLKDADVNDVRVEAWDFILHGGGAYNNLNWEYTPSIPQGTQAADTIRQYLKHLQRFVSGFNYIKMKYSPGLLIKVPDKAITRLLAQPGHQYALYIHHSNPYDAVPPASQFISKYEADTSVFNDTVTIHLDAGTYMARWYNPVTGMWKGKRIKWKQEAGNCAFHTGLFVTDIALRILKL